MSDIEHVTAPSVAVGGIDILRLELIEEAADVAIGFVVSARQHARDGDVPKLGDCLGALWTAAQVMRRAYRELGGCGDDSRAAA
jgi:hypothetical protein